MYKSILIFTLSLSISILNAQIQITDDRGYIDSHPAKSEIIIEDIDNDGVLDSISYNFENGSIEILLSSKKFNNISIPYGSFCMCNIDVKQSYMFIYESCRRNIRYSIYQYNKEREDFRLIHYANQAFGNVFQDGSGACEFDALTGEFTADWNYYDFELDSLISIPTIREKMEIPPIYLNDSVYVDIPYDTLFSYHQLLHRIEVRINKIDLDKLLILRDRDETKIMFRQKY